MALPLNDGWTARNWEGRTPGVAIEKVGHGQIDLWTLAVSQGFAEKGPVAPEIVEVMKMFALSAGVECYLARVEGRVAGGAALAIRDGVGGDCLERATEAGCDLAVCLAQPGSTS
jgi:hypothetical protein